VKKGGGDENCEKNIPNFFKKVQTHSKVVFTSAPFYCINMENISVHSRRGDEDADK
jgi:hypothetical protein